MPPPVSRSSPPLEASLYNKYGHRILTGEELTRYKQQGFFKHAG